MAAPTPQALSARSAQSATPSRSDNKGVEPEGVALLEIAGRLLAFIGLERTETSAFAVFDITDPKTVNCIDMIVTVRGQARQGQGQQRSALHPLPAWALVCHASRFGACDTARAMAAADRPSTIRALTATEKSALRAVGVRASFGGALKVACHKLLCALLLAALAGTAAARDLVLVSMSETPVKEMQRFQPLANYLAAGLKDHGITGGKVIIVPDIDSAAQVLREGRGDMVTASPYPILAISELAGTRVVLRRWKNAKVEYHCVFVTRADSPLKTLADLKGRSLAFETPNSTSGYFLPTAVLTAEGFRLRQMSGGRAAGAEEVAYSFSGAPENTAAWVLNKRVDAAAIGIHDWEDLKPGERAQMRILHATKNVPRQLVSVRGDLDPRLAAALVERLKAMDASDEGRAVLQAFETTTRFDDIPEPARQTLDLMRTVIRQGDNRKP